MPYPLRPYNGLPPLDFDEPYQPAFPDTALPAPQRVQAAQPEPNYAALPDVRPKVAAEPASKPAFDLGNVGSALWEGATQQLVPGFKSALAQAYTGINPVEPGSVAERWMAEGRQAQERSQARIAELQRAGQTDSSSEAIREAMPSLGYSGVSMLAAIPAGLAASAATTPIGGALAAGAAAGAAGYRMAGSQFLNDSLAGMEAESQKTRGRGLTEDERNRAVEVLTPVAQNTGLWEAGPEAVGNAAMFGLGRVALGLMPKEAMQKIAATTLGRAGVRAGAGSAAMGTEVATEGVTMFNQGNDQQRGQAAVDAMLAGRDPNAAMDAAPKQYQGFEGLVQATKDVAPATIATVLMMGAMAKPVHMAYSGIQQRREGNARVDDATQATADLRANLDFANETDIAEALAGFDQIEASGRLPKKAAERLNAARQQLSAELALRASPASLNEPLENARGRAGYLGFSERAHELEDDQIFDLAQRPLPDDAPQEFKAARDAYGLEARRRQDLNRAAYHFEQNPEAVSGVAKAIADIGAGKPLSKGAHGSVDYNLSSLSDNQLTRYRMAGEVLLRDHADKLGKSRSALEKSLDLLHQEADRRASGQRRDPNAVREADIAQRIAKGAKNAVKMLDGLSPDAMDRMAAGLESRAELEPGLADTARQIRERAQQERAKQAAPAPAPAPVPTQAPNIDYTAERARLSELAQQAELQGRQNANRGGVPEDYVPANRMALPAPPGLAAPQGEPTGPRDLTRADLSRPLGRLGSSRLGLSGLLPAPGQTTEATAPPTAPPSLSAPDWTAPRRPDMPPASALPVPETRQNERNRPVSPSQPVPGATQAQVQPPVAPSVVLPTGPEGTAGARPEGAGAETGGKAGAVASADRKTVSFDAPNSFGVVTNRVKDARIVDLGISHLTGNELFAVHPSLEKGGGYSVSHVGGGVRLGEPSMTEEGAIANAKTLIERAGKEKFEKVIKKLKKINDVSKIVEKPPTDAETKAGKRHWEMTLEEWLDASRLYRSGKDKMLETPSGEKVILKRESTASNFRETSRGFLEKVRRQQIDAALASGKTVPPEAMAETKPSTPQPNQEPRDEKVQAKAKAPVEPAAKPAARAADPKTAWNDATKAERAAIMGKAGFGADFTRKKLDSGDWVTLGDIPGPNQKRLSDAMADEAAGEEEAEKAKPQTIDTPAGPAKTIVDVVEPARRQSRSSSTTTKPATVATARAQLMTALGERNVIALERAGALVLHATDPTQTGAAGYVDGKGVIHLIPGNMDQTALDVALHEAMHLARDDRFAEGDRAKVRLAHAILKLGGLKNFVGNPGFSDLVQQVYRMAAEGNPVAVEALNKAKLEARADPRADVAEEAVAYLAQYADQKYPLVRRVLAAIRAALYRMGIKVNLTPADVRALALSALKARAKARATRIANMERLEIAFAKKHGWEALGDRRIDVLRRLPSDATLDDFERMAERALRSSQPDFAPTAADRAEVERQMKAIKEVRDDKGRLLAPNGKPSKLNERQWKQVRTKFFKDWFGDWENDPENASKVVDENGEPMVVYHGTDADFNKFDRSYLGDNTITNASDEWMGETSRIGFWFNKKPMTGAKYSPYSVDMPAFLNIRVANKNNETLNDLAGELESGEIDGGQFKELIENEGYDGVVVDDTEFGSKSFVVLSPTQIKSAIGNAGTFSNRSDRIDYSQPADEAEQERLWQEFQAVRAQFQARQPTETAFRRWFGKGTEGVTARDGKPIILYHGTNNPEFNRWDASRSSNASHHPTAGLGFFMTADKGAAARYGSRLLELHAKIDKPYYLTDADLTAIESVQDAVRTRRKLMAQGYDGAVVSAPGAAPYVIAFESKQVKHTTNENPTESEDFRYSRANDLIVDIPSENWLRQKQAFAKEKSKDGTPYMGEVTAYYSHPVSIQLSVLSKIKGLNDEQNNVREEALVSLKNIMATGDLPKNKMGVELLPYIEVGHDGTPFVIEGNHRIMAALDLGWKDMKVEVRYFDGGERAMGPLHPSKIATKSDGFPSRDARYSRPGRQPRLDSPRVAAKVLGDIGELRDALKPAEKAKAKIDPRNWAQMLSDLKTDKRPAWLAFLTQDMLLQLANKHLPAADVRQFDDASERMDAYEAKIIQGEAFPMAERWQNLMTRDRQQADAMSRLIYMSTWLGVDPRKAAPRNKGAEWTRAKAAYDGLTNPEARKLYGEVLAFYESQTKRLFDELAARIERHSLPEPDKLAAKDMLRQEFERMKQEGPYAPLMRFGDLTVWAEPRKRGEKPVFATFESVTEQRAFADWLKSEGYEPRIGVKMEEIEKRNLPQGDFVGKMAGIIDKTAKGPEAQLLKDAMYQLFLRSMPEQAIRKHFIHRKFVPGYSSDALRTFATFARRSAKQTARLAHADKMSDALDRMAKAVREGAVDDPVAAGHLVNEMDKSYQWAMNPTTATWASRLTHLGFMWHLGASPAHLLLNLTQQAQVTAPWLAGELAGKKGFGAVAGALLKANKDFIASNPFVDPAKRSASANQARTRLEAEWNGDMGRALKALEEAGKTDKTQTYSIAGLSEEDNFLWTRPLTRKLTQGAAWFFHVAEVINRESSAIAAYRLGRQSGMDHEAAYDLARRAINDTHFDYSPSNRARFMRGNVAKVVTLFKQYSLNVTWQLGRNAYLAARGASPQERTVARTKLLGMLGVTFAMAGAVGLPFYGEVMWLLTQLLNAARDDDEPEWDADTTVRSLLDNALSPTGEQVVRRGLVNAFLGIDLSSRIKLDDLWWRGSDSDLQGKQAAYHAMEQLLGPVAGLGVRGFASANDAIDAILSGTSARGATWRAMEGAMPKAIKDISKAFRFQSEGVTTFEGARVLEPGELGSAGSVGQLLGFAPASLTERYAENRAMMNLQQRIQRQRDALLDSYAMAYRQNDEEIMAALREDMAAFNKRYPGKKITDATLRQSLKAREKRREEIERYGGVALDKRLASLLLEGVR